MITLITFWLQIIVWDDICYNRECTGDRIAEYQPEKQSAIQKNDLPIRYDQCRVVCVFACQGTCACA